MIHESYVLECVFTIVTEYETVAGDGTGCETELLNNFMVTMFTHSLNISHISHFLQEWKWGFDTINAWEIVPHKNVDA